MRMFFEARWDVEDSVKIVTEHSLPDRETNQVERNKLLKKKEKKNELTVNADSNKNGASVKKCKNKYKALNEEENKLKSEKKGNEKTRLNEKNRKNKKNGRLNLITNPNGHEDDGSMIANENLKMNNVVKIKVNIKGNNDKIMRLSRYQKDAGNKDNKELHDYHLMSNSHDENNNNGSNNNRKRKLNKKNDENGVKNDENGVKNAKRMRCDKINENDKDNAVEKHLNKNKNLHDKCEDNSNDMDRKMDINKKINKNNKINKNDKLKKNDKTTKNEKTKKKKDFDQKKLEKKKDFDQKKLEKKKEFDQKKLEKICNNKNNSGRKKLDRSKLQQILLQAAAIEDSSKRHSRGTNENDDNNGDDDNNGNDADDNDDNNGNNGNDGDDNDDNDDNDDSHDDSMSKGKSLKDKMMARLESARFRYLNEQFYTTSSQEAVSLFNDDPQSFHAYHHGFTHQVEKWKVNPVELMIEFINARPPTLIVADLGCGDAKLAAGLRNNEVHSFDLVALNERVTVADIRKVPLATSSVDIAVFCLSLMGTNLNEYIAEANRLLKMGGTLLIAEVVSRFEKIGVFIKKLNKFGFYLISKNDTNKMFVWFELRKMEKLADKEKLVSIQLAPCVYKKR